MSILDPPTRFALPTDGPSLPDPVPPRGGGVPASASGIVTRYPESDLSSDGGADHFRVDFDFSYWVLISGASSRNSLSRNSRAAASTSAGGSVFDVNSP